MLTREVHHEICINYYRIDTTNVKTKIIQNFNGLVYIKILISVMYVPNDLQRQKLSNLLLLNVTTHIIICYYLKINSVWNKLHYIRIPDVYDVDYIHYIMHTDVHRWLEVNV